MSVLTKYSADAVIIITLIGGFLSGLYFLVMFIQMVIYAGAYAGKRIGGKFHAAKEQKCTEES